MTTKIELSDYNWHEVTGLTSGHTYYLQSKHKTVQNNYAKFAMLLFKGSTAPASDETSFVGTDFKVKADEKIFVKALSMPAIITIEGVD